MLNKRGSYGSVRNSFKTSDVNVTSKCNASDAV